MARIVIIDSGIDSSIIPCTHMDILGKQNYDKCGHGTACGLIIKQIDSNNELISIPLLDANGYASSKDLESVLKFCLNLKCDIINLSLSVLDDNTGDIEVICNLLHEQGKVIVSSVINRKEESFPANLQNVVGVRGGIFQHNNEFWYNADKKIQIIANMSPIFTTPQLHRYLIFSGNSKATAVVSGLLGHMIKMNKYKKIEQLLPLFSTKNDWSEDEIPTDIDLLVNHEQSNLKNHCYEQLKELLLDNTVIPIKALNDNDNLFKLGILSPSSFESLLKKINTLFDINLNFNNSTPKDFFTVYNLYACIRRISYEKTNKVL